MQSSSFTSVAQVAVTGPMLSVIIGGVSGKTFTSQPSGRAGYLLSCAGAGQPRAEAAAKATRRSEVRTHPFYLVSPGPETGAKGVVHGGPSAQSMRARRSASIASAVPLRVP